jgi:hypothetical protein
MQEELAANAFKAGVNVGTVMKDITTNAKQSSKDFGGNVKALTAAAVQAAKLGISLSDMTDLADKLLDIESSLTAQFEFQALTGKQINLDKARQLALEGDIAGATKSVYEQIGSIAEFEKMRPLERKKLAELMGMEVSELSKSLAIQEKLGDLTDEQQAAMANLGLSAAEIKNMSAEELKNRLTQQQSLEKASAAFSSIKDQLMSAIVPLAEVLGSVLSAIAPVIKVIGVALKPIVSVLKFIGDILTWIIDGISMLTGKAMKSLNISSDMAGSLMGAVMPGPGSTGAMFSLASQAIGDAAFPAGSGAVIMSPREGTIFPSKNDDIAVGPGVINAAQTGGSTTVVQQSNETDPALLTALISKMDMIAAALAKPVPVQIGDRVITEIGTQLSVNKSYRTSVGGR